MQLRGHPGSGSQAQHRVRPGPALNLPLAAPPRVRAGDSKAALSLLHAGPLPALSQLLSAARNVQTGRDSGDLLVQHPLSIGEDTQA